MVSPRRQFGAGLTLLAVLAVAGCGAGASRNNPTAKAPLSKEDAAAKIAEERAKLAPEDRKLVEEQEYCPIMTKEHLGEMGPPIKEMVKGQPVFLCCKGCLKAARKSPDQTLEKFAELKERVKAAKK